MVLIAVGAGIVTCIYEVGGSSRANVSEQIGGATGALSTLYIVVSLFAVLFYKIYCKIKYNASLYD